MLYWFIAAAILVGVDMMIGTQYLLVFAVAAFASGVLAFFGLDVRWQMIGATMVTLVGTYTMYSWRSKSATFPQLSLHLDVGQRVSVNHWREDGRARVSYRGTLWHGVLESTVTPTSKTMVIVGINGTQLILGPSRIV
jgi:membrane protein implicated in regulation of membrane protease activity